jgi:hypothetical protein
MTAFILLYLTKLLKMTPTEEVISLSDEYRCFVYLFEGRKENEPTERVERRYLGSFSIPFSTIFHKSRVEGVIRQDI